MPHTGDSRHAFLEEDDNGEMTLIRINLDLLIDRVVRANKPMEDMIGESPPFISQRRAILMKRP